MQIREIAQPELSLEWLLRRYTTSRRRRRLEPIYAAMLDEFKQLSRPRAVYDERPLSEVIELAEWAQNTTVAVAFVICTLGAPLDRRARELIQEDLAAAVILEDIALAGVTAVTRDIHSTIRQQAQTRNLKAGPAYRPGLGRWPMETQRTVFACLPGAEIGVALNERLFMEPMNSTSLIIPIMDPALS